MGKLILYTAATLDSMLARENGEIDFLQKYEGDTTEDYGYNSLLNRIEANVMGNKTYKQLLTLSPEFPYKNLKNFVFSKTPQTDNTDYLQFITQPPEQFVYDLKQQTSKDIWLMGGGQINSIMLNAGLIDKIILTLVPIYLGKGIPLFTTDISETKFSISSAKPFASGLLQLELENN